MGRPELGRNDDRLVRRRCQSRRGSEERDQPIRQDGRLNLKHTLLAALLLTATTARSQEPAPQLAHFHHVHLNATDPKAAIDFYTSKFDCEKGKLVDQLDGVWAQKSWLLFTKV